MQRVEPLSPRLAFLGALLFLVACSDTPTTPSKSTDCKGDDCDTDSNDSKGDDDSTDDEDDEGKDDDEDVGNVKVDAGGRDAGNARDAGRSAMADAGSTRDSGSLDSGESPVSNGDAGKTDGGGSTADAGGNPSSPGSTLPAVSDYSKKGPFTTTTTANTGPSNGYTIFRPEPLGKDGFLHAPIIFGPGILTSASNYKSLLDHLASHGFVTISVNSMSGGPGDPGNLSAMTKGLDWIIEQNSAAGVFQNKLAVDKAITMGYSIGATASVQLSSHKAIATTVVIHGHNTKGDPHGPVLMITGTDDVIGDMRKTLSTLEEAPAVLVALPIGHLDVLTELAIGSSISASSRYIAPITAWLRYWINGDTEAKRYFWGDSCEMCKSPWIPPEPNEKWKAQML